MKRSAGISGWILIGCIFAAGVLAFCGWLMGCAAPLPTPRSIRASIVWEQAQCLRAPGHEDECADGYSEIRCDRDECDCQMHVTWNGFDAPAAAHELAHCVEEAAGAAELPGSLANRDAMKRAGQRSD